MKDRHPCAYLLASGARGTIYIGVTSDVPARLYQHRNNLIAGFTSRYGVHRLVRYEMFDTMYDAIARERQLKRWHRQWKINLIESQNPEWNDLAPALASPNHRRRACRSPVMLNSFQRLRFI